MDKIVQSFTPLLYLNLPTLTGINKMQNDNVYK